MSKKRSKKALCAVLMIVLILALTGMGTLAYLTASQSGDKALVNTFIAAGGGNLVVDPDNPDPTDPTPEPDVDEDIEGLINASFCLLESPAVYVDGNYTIDGTAAKVLTNTYDKVMPSMTIAKNPTLTLNLADGASAYVFVKVTDSTAGNLTYAMTSSWVDITSSVSGLDQGEKLYVYNNAVVTGASNTVELNGVALLANDSVISAATLTDTDSSEDGMQLGELRFEAYLCQAGGFADAATAFNTCF